MAKQDSDTLSVLIFVGKFRTIYFPIVVTETEGKRCQRGQDSKRQNVRRKGPKFISQKTMSVYVYDVLQFIPQVARISQDYRVEMPKSYMKLCGEKGLNFGLKTGSYIINSNRLMHISVFIKNTLKVYLKFLLPRHVSDHIAIHPQGAIIRS